MAKFTVKYRNKSGQIDFTEVDAVNRAAVFPVLKERGITPIQITEGAMPKRKGVGGGGGGGSHSSFGFIVIVILLLAVLGGLVWWFFFHCSTKPAPSTNHQALSTNHPAPNPIAETVPAAPAKAAPTKPKTASEVASEFSDKVKEYIKKAPTNNIVWIVKPLDPDDPDNALRTGVMQELGSLLSVPPGDEMPPFPYSFLIEDDVRKAAAENGEEPPPPSHDEDDNFLATMKKWKITIKDSDSLRVATHKERLLQAQIEMLDSMDEGLTANDVIRAAYEYRKNAYELKKETTAALHEIYDSGENTKNEMMTMLDEMNRQLKEKGITTIHPSDIGFELDDEGNPILDEQPDDEESATNHPKEEGTKE